MPGVRSVRRCSRTGCTNPAVATLTYAYADSTAVVGPLATYAEPHSYDLCEEHALRLTVPKGWEVVRHEGEFSLEDTSADDLTALAEATWGEAAGAGELLYAHFSHGVGCGLIVGVQLVRGVGGVAAELGHLCVDPAGEPCWCGARGCLELHASVREAALSAGHALAAMCTAVNPGRIVLGGELAELGAAFRDPVREGFRARAMRSLRRCAVELATVAPWGGALGGLALALRESPLLARYPLPAPAEPADSADAR